MTSIIRITRKTIKKITKPAKGWRSEVVLNANHFANLPLMTPFWCSVVEWSQAVALNRDILHSMLWNKPKI